jgi:hypothetical protein
MSFATYPPQQSFGTGIPFGSPLTPFGIAWNTPNPYWSQQSAALAPQGYFGQPFGLPSVGIPLGSNPAQFRPANPVLSGPGGSVPFGLDPITAAFQQRLALQQLALQHLAVQQLALQQQLAAQNVLGNPWPGVSSPYPQVGQPIWGQAAGTPVAQAQRYLPVGVDPVTTSYAQLVPVA